MTARSPQGEEAGFFTAPEQVNQRRYEAPRGFFVEDLTHAQAGERFGYTRWAMVNLVREYRAGRLELFAPPLKPGPAPGVAPAKDRARARVIELRRQGLSTYEISARLATLDLPAMALKAGYPGTRIVPATSWLLSLLALKLTRTRRVSHVDDPLLTDPAAAPLAGLGTLPKKSALTDYSYRTSHENQRAFLAALDTQMIAGGLATSEEAIFDLDFHAIMHWGADPALEKHYVPTRSQRSRSVLTFFAQDSGTHNLVYANADLSKATQNREVIAFCDHWKNATGKDPHMLVMDQKVTTQPVLTELDQRGVKFLTPRMRSTAPLPYINSLRPADYKTITLDRAGPHNRPRVHESTTHLSNYPTTVRQLIVTGLGRDAPTVIITNDTDSPTRQLITRYARRMTIEQRPAEIIRAFHADALSSTVNLNVDLDIMLRVLAQTLITALRTRLPGYATVTPDTPQRRFLETPGHITTTPDTITVRLNHRAYSPALRQANLPDTPVPWWGNHTLRYEFA